MTYNDDGNSNNDNNNNNIIDNEMITMYIPSAFFPFHHLNNVLNKRTPFLKIFGSFFGSFFANFFLSTFNFINNCFQILHVKIEIVSGVT